MHGQTGEYIKENKLIKDQRLENKFEGMEGAIVVIM